MQHAIRNAGTLSGRRPGHVRAEMLRCGVWVSWLAVLVCLWTGYPPAAGLTAAQPVPDKPFALRVERGQTSFDLRIDSAGDQYLCLVSQLGTEREQATVRLSAEMIFPERGQSPRPLGGSPVLPLPVVTGQSAPKPATEAVLRYDDAPILLSTPSNEPALTRQFSLHVTADPLEDPAGYIPVATVCKARGARVAVWVDMSLPAEQQPTSARLFELVTTLERQVLPVIEGRLGKISDVDQDGRLAILVTPWLGRLQGGRTAVKGFVRSSDFQIDTKPPFSNQADLLYLNSDLPQGEELRTLLLHELAHAAIFSRLLAIETGPRRVPLPDWWNEGLAHTAERWGGGDWSNLDYRVSRFLADPGAAPLVVPDYYRAGLWRDHGCRGATFLFLDWCQQQFGFEKLQEITLQSGWSPLTRNDFGGLPFSEVYRHWTIDLAQSALKGNIRRWGHYTFGGPRIDAWDCAEAETQAPLTGTASQYWQLHSQRPGWYRFRLRAAPSQTLQVTLWKLPPNTATHSLVAHWKPGAGSQNWQLQIQTPHATGKTTSVILETITGEKPHQWRWRGDDLQTLPPSPELPGTWLQTAVSLPDEQPTHRFVVKVLQQAESGEQRLSAVLLPPPASLPTRVAERLP